MAELDRPTESELEAEDTIRAILEELLHGDTDRAAFHVDFCRRRAVTVGQTAFMSYLFILAGEIPQIVVDPDYRASTYRLQQMVDQAKESIAEQENDT